MRLTISAPTWQPVLAPTQHRLNMHGLNQFIIKHNSKIHSLVDFIRLINSIGYRFPSLGLVP